MQKEISILIYINLNKYYVIFYLLYFTLSTNFLKLHLDLITYLKKNTAFTLVLKKNMG